MMSNSRTMPTGHVREITSWKNICLTASIADFLVDNLLQNKLSDATVDVLCDWMATSFEVTKPNKTSLKSFFSAHNAQYPIDWQMIVGLVLKQQIKEHDNRDSNKYIQEDGQVEIQAFDYLAKLLKINVDVFDNNNKKHLLSSQQDVANSSVVLNAIYEPGQKNGGHFNRLMSDHVRFVELNSLDDQVNLGKAKSFSSDYVSQPAQVKAAVQQKLISLGCKSTSRNPSSTERKDEMKKNANSTPSRSTKTTSPWISKGAIESGLKTAKGSLADVKGFFDTELKARGVDAAKGDKTVKYGDSTLGIKTVFVTQKDQEELDRLLAIKLQEEELNHCETPKPR